MLLAALLSHNCWIQSARMLCIQFDESGHLHASMKPSSQSRWQRAHHLQKFPTSLWFLLVFVWFCFQCVCVKNTQYGILSCVRCEQVKKNSTDLIGVFLKQGFDFHSHFVIDLLSPVESEFALNKNQSPALCINSSLSTEGTVQELVFKLMPWKVVSLRKFPCSVESNLELWLRGYGLGCHV